MYLKTELTAIKTNERCITQALQQKLFRYASKASDLKRVYKISALFTNVQFAMMKLTALEPVKNINSSTRVIHEYYK